MNEPHKIRYRNWYIVPFAFPLPNGKWSANCEIEKSGGIGIDSFQGAQKEVVCDRKDKAIEAACENAKRHIDAIIADPLR